MKNKLNSMKAKLIMIVLPVVIAVIAILLVLTYEKSKTIMNLHEQYLKLQKTPRHFLWLYRKPMRKAKMLVQRCR